MLGIVVPQYCGFTWVVWENNPKLNNYKILYGGSVKADNAKEIVSLSNVDGALIGGASLKSDDFTKIIAD